MLQLKKKNTNTNTNADEETHHSSVITKASWVALASSSVITKSKQNHAEIDVSDYIHIS